MRQAYFEIQVATDSSLLAQGKADLWNSGKVESSASVMVLIEGKSCDLVCWPIGKSGYGTIRGILGLESNQSLWDRAFG